MDRQDRGDLIKGGEAVVPDPRRLGWKRGAIWAACGVGVVFLYFFGYPVFLLYFSETYPEEMIDYLPEWLLEALDGFMAPIIWLYDSFRPYEIAIDWLLDSVGL